MNTHLSCAVTVFMPCCALRVSVEINCQQVHSKSRDLERGRMLLCEAPPYCVYPVTASLYKPVGSSVINVIFEVALNSGYLQY
jgi:hypothetical protein